PSTASSPGPVRRRTGTGRPARASLLRRRPRSAGTGCRRRAGAAGSRGSPDVLTVPHQAIAMDELGHGPRRDRPRLPDMSAPLVLAADVETELSEKRSRFLTRLHRVEGVEQADSLLRAARAQHPDDRHHCTALVLGETADRAEMHRSNDDGEPAGTAGMPEVQFLLPGGLRGTGAGGQPASRRVALLAGVRG